MNTITKEQRDSIMARDAQLSEWIGKRRSYRPEEVPLWIHAPTNDERALVELYDFIHSPPDRYFAYPDNEERSITNWTGLSLGKIIKLGREFRSNMGDKRRSFTLAAINGKTYHGTIYGTYCRMRAAR